MTIALRDEKLGEIADLNPNLAEPLNSNTPVSFVPMSAVSAETASTTSGESRRYSDVSKGYTPFLDGDLLVAKITPCFENGKIAQARLTHRIGFGSTEFHVVRPKPGKANTRYLLHFLRQECIRRDGARKMTGSAGQRRAPEHFLAELRVPLPSLPEQRRIAAILDKADALRAKRRAALVQLDTLTQSIFLEMFGDPGRRGWEMATIADYAASEQSAIRTGPFGSQLLHSEFSESGVAVLGIDNAVANEFRWGERRYITTAKYQQLRRYTVRPGDVLITIMGTCGRCAVVPDDIPPAINSKHLCCITLDQSQCVPAFLHAYFTRHPLALQYLRQTGKGAIMSGLNMSIIKEMPIPRVPIDLQLEFASRSDAIEGLIASHRASLASLDALFASLQHRAFRGEL